MSGKAKRKDAAAAAPPAPAEVKADAAAEAADAIDTGNGNGSGGEVVDAQEIAAKLVLDTKARGPGITDALATDVFEDSQDVNLNPDVYAVRDDTAPEPNTAAKAVGVALALVVASAVYKGEPLPLVGTYPTQAVRWLWAQGAALSTSTWLLLTIVPVVAYAYYVVFWRPLMYTRKLVHKPVKRAVSSLPPPYPNGWFKVADSHELPPGALKSLKVLGQELVLFRGYGTTAYHSDGTAITNSRHTLDHKDSAKDRRGAGPAEGTPALAELGHQQAVHVLDAFCPHLGANLAVGGKVTGDCVECPFHGWLFRGSDGKCTHIPYSNGAIPAAAKTRSWPTREVNGCVYLWHDLDGRPPSWEPLPLDNTDSGERTTSPGSGECARHPGPAPRAASLCQRLFGCRSGLRFHGRTRHFVGGHIQEIPENGVDTAHFHHLHTPLLSFVRFKWNAVWAPSRAADESHITNMQIDTQITVFGWTLPFVKFSCYIRQIGPALVHLVFRYPFGRLLCVESVTPMAPLLQRCEHTMFADWWVPRVIPKAVLKILSLQFERDVPIWSNKQLLAKPTLVKEDGRVVQFRQWYRQFYQSANGNKRREALDW